MKLTFLLLFLIISNSLVFCQNCFSKSTNSSLQGMGMICDDFIHEVYIDGVNVTSLILNNKKSFREKRELFVNITQNSRIAIKTSNIVNSPAYLLAEIRTSTGFYTTSTDGW